MQFDHFTASLISSTQYWKKILEQFGLLLVHEADCDFLVRLLLGLRVSKVVTEIEFTKLIEAAVE